LTLVPLWELLPRTTILVDFPSCLDLKCAQRNEIQCVLTLLRVFVDLKGEEMATDKKIGRRELITRALTGGLAVGTFALSGKTALWAEETKKEILTLDISTIDELPQPRTCASYNTKRFECTKYRAYKNFSKACRARYSARCGFFFCH